MLHAAAHHCKGRIKAVAALNPGHSGIDAPDDLLPKLNEYHKGKPFSGENGDLKEGLNLNPSLALTRPRP